MVTIRSRDNPFVKQLVALAHSSRERRKSGLTVLDGIHLVRAFLHVLENLRRPVLVHAVRDHADQL